MNDRISDKDKKAWKEFISKNESLPNKDFELNKEKFTKISRIDLHGYNLENANSKIEEFIIKSFDNKVSKIIVVTGKGLHSNVEKDPYISKDLSILKNSVPEFINSNAELMEKIIEIKDADINEGGSGAFYIFLKKKL